MMKLYTYWRSSAAYRLRIALNLKGVAYDSAFVHLARNGGEHLTDDYAALNPQRLVPTLELDRGDVLTQSLAICEYLEETHPEPPILPADALGRARVRALAQAVACDIHPINNLRVLNYLTGTIGIDAESKSAWYRHWIVEGFAAIERMLDAGPATGQFCHGDHPSLADICLVPQAYNARRFHVDLDPYPTIRRIEAACLALDAFRSAAPEAQNDATPDAA
jgi:maleylacetoacetate isomerase